MASSNLTSRKGKTKISDYLRTYQRFHPLSEPEWRRIADIWGHEDGEPKAVSSHPESHIRPEYPKQTSFLLEETTKERPVAISAALLSISRRIVTDRGPPTQKNPRRIKNPRSSRLKRSNLISRIRIRTVRKTSEADLVPRARPGNWRPSPYQGHSH